MKECDDPWEIMKLHAAMDGEAIDWEKKYKRLAYFNIFFVVINIAGLIIATIIG